MKLDESRRRFKNNAYITLLSSEDYLDAVLVLNRSLKYSKSNYALVVAVTEDIYDKVHDILCEDGCIVEKIERISYSDYITSKYKDHSVLNTASKINLFSLKNYDKLVYLDADSIVMKNVDDLFNYPDGAMLKSDVDMGFGLSNLFVFYPRNHEEELYKKLIEDSVHFDGDLLGNLWFFTRSSEAHQISPEYCASYHEECIDPNTKIYHFVNKNKPWLNIDNFKDTEVIKLYKKLLKNVDLNLLNNLRKYSWKSLFRK